MSELERLVTVSEVAKQAGWPYRRMLRHLQASDKELGGTLLIKRGTGKHARYSLTVGSLEKLHPQWTKKQSGLVASVTEHETKLQELDVLLEQAHKTIGELIALRKADAKKIERLEARFNRERADTSSKIRMIEGLGLARAGDF
jgi:molybdenum-dependent DNA-binding transcriptional regulator ModE